MSNFKNIEKLGLNPRKDNRYESSYFVDAEDLENLLQSAQVVYGNDSGNESVWFATPSAKGSDTRTALVVAITPIKKKTKAEAALEFVEKFKSGMLSHVGYLEAEKEAIRILEMKDEV